jgi:hypothetical protein
MTYGVKIQGSDTGGSYLVIDSAETPLNYSVVATGTASSVDLSTGAGTTDPNDRYFVLVNIKGANFTGTYAGERLVSAQTSSGTITFYAIDPDYRSDGTPYDFTVTSIAVDYILIKSMSDLNNNISGDYGVQIYDGGTPNTLIFDSRKFNSADTFFFSNINPPRSISGDNSVADSILSTTNEYVDIAQFSYDIPVGSLDSGYWDALYSPSSSSNTVKYSGVFIINEEGVNDRSSNYRVRPNFFSIAVGDLR